MKTIWNCLSKTTTASILAILWTIIAGIAITLAITGTTTATDAVQTMVLQGVFGIIMYIVGFYHGGSENRRKKEDLSEE